MDRFVTTSLPQRLAFPSVKPNASAPLVKLLGDFRSAYDSLVSEFNTRISTVPPNDVWKEYRDFRVKTNDLVAETIRTLNNTFPVDAAALRSAIQRGKEGITVLSG